jgi:hypothetical protein
MEEALRLPSVATLSRRYRHSGSDRHTAEVAPASGGPTLLAVIPSTSISVPKGLATSFQEPTCVPALPFTRLARMARRIGTPVTDELSRACDIEYRSVRYQKCALSRGRRTLKIAALLRMARGFHALATAFHPAGAVAVRFTICLD